MFDLRLLAYEACNEIYLMRFPTLPGMQAFPNPRESSTCNRISPSFCRLMCLMRTQGSSVARDMTKKSR